jgi:hypothetical protein
MSGVFAYTSYLRIKEIMNMRRRRREYPSLEAVVPSETCKSLHKWESIKLVMSGLPAGSYKVCIDCGMVSHGRNNLKLNKPGLEVYRNEINNRLKLKDIQADMNIKKHGELKKVLNELLKYYYPELLGDKDYQCKLLERFFTRSIIEIDQVYDSLNKELEEKLKNG